MKPHLRSLKRGEQVWAVIEEAIAQNEVVVNFGGDLIRVGNNTGHALRAGQRVLLQVVDMKPFRFKLVSNRNPQARSRLRSLDVSI